MADFTSDFTYDFDSEGEASPPVVIGVSHHLFYAPARHNPRARMRRLVPAPRLKGRRVVRAPKRKSDFL